ncbi:MAG: response regulator [Treponema sp.]|nr:response regulator [Treponema sp.]
MSYRVLIVEDDPMVSMINEQYVHKNKQFSVCGSCRNGQEAIEFLSKENVDLVIMDVYMPFMDGVETLKQIREKKFNTEVIMVTAANDTATLENTMHLGVIDYLIKPFAYERFQVALEKFDAKKAALNGASVLDQDCVDSIITSAKKCVVKDFPKGIQEKTMELILSYLKEQSGWISGDSIAENVGLSGVTVRHYMSYMVDNGIAVQSINYETGGRPCILYKKG